MMEGAYVRIVTATGWMEVAYEWLARQAPDSKRRKIVALAAESGGWEMIGGEDLGEESDKLEEDA